MKKLILSVILAAAGMITAAAQDYKDLFEQFSKNSDKDFLEFKQKSNREFKDFRDRANAEYSEFLRKAWEEFHGNEPMKRKEEKPIVPPVITIGPDDEQNDKEIEFDEEVPVLPPAPTPKPIAPIEENREPVNRYVKFTKYGTEGQIRFDADMKPILNGTDETSVADFWVAMASLEMTENLLFDFMILKQERELCDWAFYKFVDEFSKTIYKDNIDAAELLKAFILAQSGYKLRIGYSEEDKRIHILMALNEDVYNVSSWTIEGKNYYLFDSADIEVMKIVSADFEGSVPMNLSVGIGNQFDENTSSSRDLISTWYPQASISLSSNHNLLAFYDEFPDYASDFRWTFYAQTPLNSVIRERLYSQFENILQGKTELQAANMLLNFVQTAFIYKYDEDIWGRDRSFFAEESLYYPYCDCEDRSILFSHLIRDLLGLEVALIYSPGHLFTAVNFSENVSGAYVMIGDRKFIICEPTCIDGAPVGISGVGPDTEGIQVGLLQKIDYGKSYKVSLVSRKPYKKSLFPVSQGGRYGFKNADGKIIVACEYDSVSDYEQGDLALYSAKKGNVYSLFYPDGELAVGGITGYIPVNVKNLIGRDGQPYRGDYFAIVRFEDDNKWYFINTILGWMPSDFCFEEYVMDDVTYDNNVYSKEIQESANSLYNHYIILKRESDQKYGLIDPSCGAVVVPFKYDFIHFVPGDKSKLVLYESDHTTICNL